MQAVSETSRPAVSTARRIAAWAAIVLGGLGIVLSLLGTGAVWWGRSAVDNMAAQLTTGVDNGLQQVDDRLGTAVDQLGQARGKVQGWQTTAQQLGSGPAGRAAADRLVAAIDRELGAPVSALREAYSAVQERVASAAELLSSLDRLPRVDVPQLPVEQLQAFDTRVREVDGNLREVRQSLEDEGLPLSEVGARIAEPLGAIDTRIAGIETATDDLSTTFENAQASVAQVYGTVRSATLIGAGALTLLLLWNALLHLLLLIRGRAWLAGDPRI